MQTKGYRRLESSILSRMECVRLFKLSILRARLDCLSGSFIKLRIRIFSCYRITNLNSLRNRCLSMCLFCTWLSIRSSVRSSYKGPRASLCLLELQRPLKPSSST